jgi:hypothetical protein
MGRPRKEELRERKREELTELTRVVIATSERLDAVKRAKALLAVAAGATWTAAGQDAGRSREALAQRVHRFHQHGQTVLETASGRGRKPTSTSEQRTRVLAELQREPDRKKDHTAPWSLALFPRGAQRAC